MSQTVTITGRYPPPIDGQTVATRRLASLLEAELDVHRVNVSSGNSRFAESKVLFRPAKIWHYLSATPRLRRELSHAKDAPVLWTSVSPAPLGHLRDWLTIVPAFADSQQVYAVVHWGDFDRLFHSSLTRFTASRLVERLAGFVFLSRNLSERCRPWIPDDKRFIVPNTIDDSLVCSEDELSLKRDERANRSSLRLLFLSNMTPSKGFMDVLHATRMLLERGVDVQADFVGRWETREDRKKFHTEVDRNRLDTHVTHHEAISNREKIKALHLQADVFVLPTYYPTEAQPLTIIEALNAGTPVVTTRHAGIPEMVDDEQEARFVSPRSPAEIADAVTNLQSTDTWMAYSRAARQRFIDRFSPDAVRQQWLALLNQSNQSSAPAVAQHDR